jgi:hypothetical protein
VTRAKVLVLLGTKYTQMMGQEISDTLDWYIQLKVQCSLYCMDRAVQDVLYSALEIGVPFKNIKSIKIRWKGCKTEAELGTMGKLITRMRTEFRFASKKPSWKEQVELDFMKEYKLAYFENELFKKRLGCIAKRKASHEVS